MAPPQYVDHAFGHPGPVTAQVSYRAFTRVVSHYIRLRRIVSPIGEAITVEYGVEIFSLVPAGVTGGYVK